MSSKLATFFSALLSCSFLYADVTHQPLPSHTLNKDDWTISFADGRKAQMTVARTLSKYLDMPMLMTENTCNRAPVPSCEFHVPIVIHRYSWRWVEHPQSERLNKTLIFTDSFGNVRTFSQTTTTGSVEWRQNAEKGLGPEKLVCDQYRWLAAGSGQERLKKIYAIHMEGMSANPETGVDENRHSGSLIDIDLTSNDDNELIFSHVQHYTALIPLLFTPLNNVMAIWLEDPKSEELCQISYTLSFLSIIPNVSDAQGETRGIARPTTELSPSLIRSFEQMAELLDTEGELK